MSEHRSETRDRLGVMSEHGSEARDRLELMSEHGSEARDRLRLMSEHDCVFWVSGLAFWQPEIWEFVEQIWSLELPQA